MEGEWEAGLKVVRVANTRPVQESKDVKLLVGKEQEQREIPGKEHILHGAGPQRT